MSDLVDILRKHAGTRSDVDAYLHAHAADEIERLEQLVATLLAKLTGGSDEVDGT